MSGLVISAQKFDALSPREQQLWEPLDKSERFYGRKPDEPQPPPAVEPTDEQLENLAFGLGMGMLASPIIRRLPYWRTSMLNLHALAQRALHGDERAAERIALLKLALTLPHDDSFEPAPPDGPTPAASA